MSQRKSGPATNATEQYWRNVGTGAAVVGEAALITAAAAAMAPAFISWWAISAVTGCDGPFDN